MELVMVQDTLYYTCGSPLFPSIHSLYDGVVVREGLSCTSPIETQYYAGIFIVIQCKLYDKLVHKAWYFVVSTDMYCMKYKG